MEKWIITPQNMPTVLRSCSKCGTKTRFTCSGNFRINANGNALDVWLIYKCEYCDATWNMTILTRMRPKQIEDCLYQSFLRNDMELAKKYAFNKAVLAANQARADYSTVSYVTEKRMYSDGTHRLEIVCAEDFSLRLDKLISVEIGISRIQSKLLLERNHLSHSMREHGKITIEEFWPYEGNELIR